MVDYICRNAFMIDCLIVGYASMWCLHSFVGMLVLRDSLRACACVFFLVKQQNCFPMEDCMCPSSACSGPLLTMTVLPCRYENLEVSMNCGSMLQECIRHEELARLVFRSENFWKLFQYVSCHNFDIQSDAFKTFKELLTTHKTLAAEFLAEEFDAVSFFLFSSLGGVFSCRQVVCSLLPLCFCFVCLY